MAAPDRPNEGHIEPHEIGATLRNAREAAQLSVADVAERMRLSRHHVENLEAERFELFPVSVFLRGYLTSYARLVGIDPEPLLEAYDRRGFGPPRLHSPGDAQTTPARGSEFTVTVTTLIVVAVLIVLSALWWREQWAENGPGGLPLPETTADRPAEDGAGGSRTEEALTSEEALASDEGDLAIATDEGPEVGDASGSEAEAEPGESGGVAAGSSEPVPVPSDGAEESADDAPLTATLAAPAPPSDSAEGAPVRIAESGGGVAAGELASIVIEVREDCWLMIRDAEERLIYRDLALAGSVLTLSGAPPVRVVAGYPDGIDIVYDGEPVDLTPYIEQDTGTARFQLGS